MATRCRGGSASGTREILKLFLLPLSQAHSGASTVLVDGLDAGVSNAHRIARSLADVSDVSVSFSSARPAVATQRASQDAIGLSHRSP